MTAIGLDLCNPAKGTVMYEDQLMTLVSKKSLFTTFLFDVCKNYIEAPKFNWAKKGCVLYDILAAATLVDRSLVTTEKSNVRVEIIGEFTSGQTIAYPSENGNVDVGVDVDGPRFVKLFLQRIQSLVDRSVDAAANA